MMKSPSPRRKAAHHQQHKISTNSVDVIKGEQHVQKNAHLNNKQHSAPGGAQGTIQYNESTTQPEINVENKINIPQNISVRENNINNDQCEDERESDLEMNQI